MSFVTCVAFATACSGKPAASTADSAASARATKTPDSAAGAIATNGAGDKSAANNDTAKGKLPSNKMGKIPVLEYHVIGGDKNTLYTRTAASYRKRSARELSRSFIEITRESRGSAEK